MEKKHVVIGVSGGIAAYKACDLVSKLSKKDYEIKVVMTKHAQEFVKPINFESLSKHKCEVSLFDETNEDPIAHITLAKWADIMVLVPATANIIAKVVHGIADDIVSTTFLACHTKKLICPAMNVHMYENEVTQRNIKLAKELGYKFVEPVVGHLACNDTGKGKLADVQDIVSAIDHEFELEQTLKGKNVLVSAGPTQEALDPVRFLSNHSSGKQGYAIAKAAKALGANVTLVAGPTALEDLNDVNMVHVTSAQDMFDAITSRLDVQNYIIMAAAVADYRPEIVADQKIKKSDEEVTFHFVKNPDILAYIGQHKKENQVICGFAMETQNLEENARKKLESKNCDMLIANNLFTSGMLKNFLDRSNVHEKQIDAVIVSSVVPKVMHSFTNGIKKFVGIEPLIVGPGIKSGISVQLENPRNVGADRIADCAGAFSEYGGPILVADFGTATTYDYVDENGCFKAGAIGVGIETGANALWGQTAQLPEIEIKRPKTILARNTQTEMQAGVFYQFLGGVEYTIAQFKKEVGKDMKVIATGGLGRIVCNYTKSIDVYDPNLIFKGLKVIYEKNKD